MNILVLGSGAREHALVWKLAQSSRCERLFVAPGNAGTATIAQNIALDILDFKSLAEFVLREKVQMMVVGPEAPLVEGITDYFHNRADLKHVWVIGPTQAGAKLEGSKDFSKNFMLKYGIPTAKSKTFTKQDISEGYHFIHTFKGKIVLKADGLAAGKGVIITDNKEEAWGVLKDMLVNERFGHASARVLIEEYLEGIEVSVFVLTDGKNYKILPEAKDYKRVGEADAGLNTGGMGAVSPVPFADKAFMDKVEQEIVIPTLRGLNNENIHYQGIIFLGIMKVGAQPYLLEYNVRFGDPEAEVVIPRIRTDFVELFEKTALGQLNSINIQTTSQTATTVMLVSGGYPEAFQKGIAMSGLDLIESEVLPFHAGTILKNDQLLTNGGRVMALTALADSLPEALALSNKAALTVQYENKYYRRDIGFDL
ncbi:MAG: phosphoribosylamine--glycine ligase [Cytophagales bacterium]|nr:MAG: phosphoribosylamine--glycine ligase [Cytophagales bacterium]TAF59520.1 MAG: phosphoribosylamine--glycine ligase [Cytophagales bacterium]